MFASRLPRRDFAETRALEPALAFPGLGDASDASDAFDQANAADRALLRLVAWAAGATLLLALLSTLQ